MATKPKITRQTMWPLLLASVPEFQTQRDAFLVEWASEGEPLPEFLSMRDLAAFTIKAFENGELGQVQRVLDIVDTWVCHGDDDVYELAIVGFIEDLSNGAMHDTTDPDIFERFMSARVKAEWDDLRAGWARLRDA